MIQQMPSDSVRGRIRVWLDTQAKHLQSVVLDIGSRISTPDSWWADNRSLRPDLKWFGVDMQAGANVDRLEDVARLSFADEIFGSVICTEVLEHVWQPDAIVHEAYRVLKHGAPVLFTTPFCFPVHNFPSDYWRLTPRALEQLMERAGFARVIVETAGVVAFELNDHGEVGITHREAPIHVFGIGWKL